MATTQNIGRVVPVYKGDWDATVQYAKLDVVYQDSSKSSYVALKDNKNVDPSTDNTHTNWGVLSRAKYVVGSDDLTTAVNKVLTSGTQTIANINVKSLKPTISFFGGNGTTQTSSITETTPGTLSVNGNMSVSGDLVATASLAKNLDHTVKLNNQVLDLRSGVANEITANTRLSFIDTGTDVSKHGDVYAFNARYSINGQYLGTPDDTKDWNGIIDVISGGDTKNYSLKLTDFTTGDIYYRTKTNGTWSTWGGFNSNQYSDDTYIKKSGDTMSGGLTTSQVNVGSGSIVKIDDSHTQLKGITSDVVNIEANTNLDDLLETGIYIVGAYNIAKTLKNYPGNSSEYNYGEALINGDGYDMIGFIEVMSNQYPAKGAKWLYVVQRVTYYKGDRSNRREATRVITSDGSGTLSYSSWDIRVLDMASGSIPWVNGGNGTPSGVAINYRITGDTLSLYASGTFVVSTAANTDVSISGKMAVLNTLQAYSPISNWGANGMFQSKYARYRMLDGVVIMNAGTNGITTGSTWFNIAGVYPIYFNREHISY